MKIVKGKQRVVGSRQWAANSRQQTANGNTRKWSAYELNHLIALGFDPFELAKTVDPDIPVEYVTGKALFREHYFVVNEHTLIPRIETEQIVQLALAEKRGEISRNPTYELQIADIGTGSGAIGISIGLILIEQGINFSITLADNSTQALKIARQNLQQLVPQKYQDKFKLTQSDLLDGLQTDVDIIVANLPYIPSTRIDTLQRSVKDFEPASALDGGEDGLKYIRKLLNSAFRNPKSAPQVVLEVDDTHTDPREFSDKWNIGLVNDINGKNRFWVCRVGG